MCYYLCLYGKLAFFLLWRWFEHLDLDESILVQLRVMDGVKQLLILGNLPGLFCFFNFLIESILALLLKLLLEIVLPLINFHLLSL